MQTVSSSTAVPTHAKPFAASGLVRDFSFEDVKLSCLVEHKHNLIRALTTAPLEEVLETMRNNNISGLPIFDISQRKYVGILTFFDILVYVAFGSFKRELLKSDLESISFGKMLAGDLLGISDSERFIWNFDQEDSLEAALEPLSKGVHRIIVNKRKVQAAPSAPSHSIGSGKEEQVESQIQSSCSGVVGGPTPEVKHRLVSQIDVVTFLYHFAADKALPMLKRNLIELSLVNTLKGSSPVIVPQTFSALDAMQKMYHSKVNAVGIVDGEGKLIANLSTSDLRYLTKDRFTSVFLPVVLFLQQLHGQKPAKPITVHPASTLDEVMLKVITGKVKRVWIVDSTEVPVGVVTLTDIISKFSPHDPTLIRASEEAQRR